MLFEVVSRVIIFKAMTAGLASLNPWKRLGIFVVFVCLFCSGLVSGVCLFYFFISFLCRVIFVMQRFTCK